MTGRDDITWAKCLSMQSESRNGALLMWDVHLGFKIITAMIRGVEAALLPEKPMSK